MPLFEASSIQQVILHRVGNQATEEGYVLSAEPLRLTEQLQDLLIRYFLTPFKGEEYYHLSDSPELASQAEDDAPRSNPVYDSAQAIFDNPDNLLEESKLLARQLYGASTHPNIKGGELFVVYFSECQLFGETMDAVGLFKSENKESFLRVLHDEEQWSTREDDPSAQSQYRLEAQQGINPNKLDKGAIIFNSEADKGYIVSVVDATNRGLDAQYWKDTYYE